MALLAISSQLVSENRICKLYLINQEHEKIPLHAEIADSDRLHQQGLMYRKHLPKDRGMLFVFEGEHRLVFWMKNTYLPLSIAYISSDGFVREIYHMKPLDTRKTYPSRYPAKYALEVNQGWFFKNKITIGSRLILDGCLSK